MDLNTTNLTKLTNQKVICSFQCILGGFENPELQNACPTRLLVSDLLISKPLRWP